MAISVHETFLIYVFFNFKKIQEGTGILLFLLKAIISLITEFGLVLSFHI